MSQDLGYADRQVYFIRPYLPEAEIKQFWNEGYHITSLAYGDNQWVVIISQGAGYVTPSPMFGVTIFPRQNYGSIGPQVITSPVLPTVTLNGL
jgi:hypothetical protein